MQIQFENLADFLYMGGYYAYVWSIYALVLVFLATSFLYVIFSLIKLKNQAKAEVKNQYSSAKNSEKNL